MSSVAEARRSRARDVGWMRTLTAGRMMRHDPVTLPAEASLAELHRRVPLGATSRIVLVDGAGRYARYVPTAATYAEGIDPAAHASTLAIHRDAGLAPDLDIVQVMKRFDASGADELVVLDEGPGGAGGHVTQHGVAQRLVGIDSTLDP